MTDLKYKTTLDLPKELQEYTIYLTNKSSYKIKGDELEGIMKAQTNFIKLKRGDIINKNFIINIILDRNINMTMFEQLNNGELIIKT